MRPTMYVESIGLGSAVLTNADLYMAVYGELLEQTSPASIRKHSRHQLAKLRTIHGLDGE
jgi:hypothetical protein